MIGVKRPSMIAQTVESWIFTNRSRTFCARVTHNLSAPMVRTLSALLMAVIVLAAGAESASRKRSIEMEITLPTGDLAHALVAEGEGAIIRLRDQSRFGFVPTIRA